MRIKINYSSLLRTDTDNLFKWAKNGVILIRPNINLSNLNKTDALEILDKLEDNIELTFQKKQDIEEVRNYIIELDNRSGDYDYLDEYLND